jgi:hypothetical protein
MTTAVILRACCGSHGRARNGGICRTSAANGAAIHETVQFRTREEIIWQGHFPIGCLFFTLTNADRLARPSDGEFAPWLDVVFHKAGSV